MRRDTPEGRPPPAEGADCVRELHSYVVGYGLALALTLVPFGLVAFTSIARTTLLWIIGSFELVQIIVHLRFFLHVDVSRQKREDLQLILFSTLILLIMIGGTIWIIFNLYTRMAPALLP